MRLIRGVGALGVASCADIVSSGCVATIGNFDGVHLGHQAVIGQLQRQASQAQLPAVVIVFEPQPLEYFAPEQAPARLSTFREKFELLRQLNVDAVVCLRFDAAFAAQSAAQFCEAVLLNGLNVRHLVVGDDFRFGSDRKGDFEFLQGFGAQHGFTVEDTQTHEVDGVRASSTAIREALLSGDMARAAQQLGRAYGFSGRISYGDQIGRTIDFPTANLLLKRLVSPVKGVYAVDFTVLGQGAQSTQRFNGVANVGSRPTVKGTQVRLETHVFDFSGDLYGQRVSVILRHKIRDEKKFAGLDALRAQIAKDVEAARAYFDQN